MKARFVLDSLSFSLILVVTLSVGAPAQAEKYGDQFGKDTGGYDPSKDRPIQSDNSAAERREREEREAAARERAEREERERQRAERRAQQEAEQRSQDESNARQEQSERERQRQEAEERRRRQNSNSNSSNNKNNSKKPKKDTRLGRTDAEIRRERERQRQQQNNKKTKRPKMNSDRDRRQQEEAQRIRENQAAWERQQQLQEEQRRREQWRAQEEQRRRNEWQWQENQRREEERRRRERERQNAQTKPPANNTNNEFNFGNGGNTTKPPANNTNNEFNFGNGGNTTTTTNDGFPPFNDNNTVITPPFGAEETANEDIKPPFEDEEEIKPPFDDEEEIKPPFDDEELPPQTNKEPTITLNPETDPILDNDAPFDPDKLKGDELIEYWQKRWRMEHEALQKLHKMLEDQKLKSFYDSVPKEEDSAPNNKNEDPLKNKLQGHLKDRAKDTIIQKYSDEIRNRPGSRVSLVALELLNAIDDQQKIEKAEEITRKLHQAREESEVKFQGLIAQKQAYEALQKSQGNLTVEQTRDLQRVKRELIENEIDRRQAIQITKELLLKVED